MRVSIMLATGAAALALAAAAQVTVADAVTADVARQCRALMLHAYPAHIYGATGNAVQQRSFFQECVKRNGKMDEGSDPAGASDKDRH